MTHIPGSPHQNRLPPVDQTGHIRTQEPYEITTESLKRAIKRLDKGLPISEPPRRYEQKILRLALDGLKWRQAFGMVDGDGVLCPRCGEMRDADVPDGCRDPKCERLT